MSREPSASDSPTALEEVRDRVVSWLVNEGWQTAAGSGEGAAWALRGQDPGGKVVIFALESRSPHRLVLHSSVRLDDSHSEKLDALESSEQDDLCWQIRLKLLDMRVDFQGVALPLQQINLRMRLYTEDMTRTTFFDTVGAMQNAMLYVIWTVRRVLDQPALQEDETDLRIN
jgi:hypothetical protein